MEEWALREHTEQYYHENVGYSEFLESQSLESYRKYASILIEYSRVGERILDVGCGTGQALDLITKMCPGRAVHGIDVSRTSIEKCMERSLSCLVYDGRSIPFGDTYFDVVGSFNVLEHVTYPYDLLAEKLRVLKTGGHLVIACPNFLSITNSYHPHTKGLRQKLRNLIDTLRKSCARGLGFERMEVTVREQIQPDDDACNATNPADILAWAKGRGLELEYWSGQTYEMSRFADLLDRSFLRLFLGSTLAVFRKLAKP